MPASPLVCVQIQLAPYMPWRRNALPRRSLTTVFTTQPLTAEVVKGPDSGQEIGPDWQLIRGRESEPFYCSAPTLQGGAEFQAGLDFANKLRNRLRTEYRRTGRETV